MARSSSSSLSSHERAGLSPQTTPPPVAQLVRAAAARLEYAGIAGPDARLLLSHALACTPGRLRMLEALGETVSEECAERFEQLLTRRIAREPLQHITGTAAFRNIELEVGPGAFVPRPETELLVELALECLPEGGSVIDAGTGSGAIAISIATERPDASVAAIEASPAAFVWAKRNVLRLAPGIRLVHDLFERALATTSGLDVLVSNPPYVPHAAIPRDVEVFLHDPKQALYSGPDGLDAIRSLAAVGTRAVRSGGSILLEHAEHQGAAVREILLDAGWRGPVTSPDLTGRDRVTAARRD
ncbi:peptide chain release factor N(5)-glutamine methyltransferase [uncultured Agrococcus sp.]|uniref:peptide chain release factor N(5)-glutamine methyltransferase n=1 Tax=uncultured Agrococcus sp. TaxID=382258 RepID=UPI0025DEFC17|nr:peptide chain release factor N(5)-glutamine methyltransferase [uncultured Agrococcus sp.]